MAVFNARNITAQQARALLNYALRYLFLFSQLLQAFANNYARVSCELRSQRGAKCITNQPGIESPATLLHRRPAEFIGLDC